MSVPNELAAGDTWSFVVAGGSYPATSGWSVTLVAFNTERRFTIDSSASGADHLLERTAAQSSAVIPGAYNFALFAKKAAERYRIGQGRLVVTPNLEGERPFDTRTTARKILDQLEAAHLAYMESGDENALVASYAYGDRTVQVHTPEQSIKWIEYWRAQVYAEEQALAISNGLGNPRRFGVRFG